MGKVGGSEEAGRMGWHVLYERPTAVILAVESFTALFNSLLALLPVVSRILHSLVSVCCPRFHDETFYFVMSPVLLHLITAAGFITRT